MAAQGEPKRNVTVQLSTGWIEALDRKAAELGMTRSDLIRSSVPLEEQLVKADVHPKPTRDPVPRGEAHERTEDLVTEGSRTRIADYSRQGVPIEPSHDNIAQSRARSKTR